MFDFSELTNTSEYVKIFAGLFAMVDPVGATPVYLSATSGVSADVRKRIATTAVLTMIGILAVFVFFGDAILELFGIDLAAFQVAGGLLLLVTAFQLMTGRVHSSDEVPPEEQHLVGVVPIGIPLLAGPATISASMVFSADHEGVTHDIVLMLTVLAMAALVFVIFRLAPTIERRLSGSALAAFTRVMGLIVAAIAVEFLFAGILFHFPGLL